MCQSTRLVGIFSTWRTLENRERPLHQQKLSGCLLDDIGEVVGSGLHTPRGTTQLKVCFYITVSDCRGPSVTLREAVFTFTRHVSTYINMTKKSKVHQTSSNYIEKGWTALTSLSSLLWTCSCDSLQVTELLPMVRAWAGKPKAKWWNTIADTSSDISWRIIINWAY